MTDRKGETLYYFGYGSNLFVPRIVDRVPSAETVSTATVRGYRLRFDKAGFDGSAKANMFFSDNSNDEIRGAIYAIDASEKPLLDAAEGVEVGSGYVPVEMALTCDAGNTYDVFVYIADDAVIDQALTPYTWYRDLVLEGARSHGFPDNYCEEIAGVEVIEDEDSLRDKVNRYGIL